MLEFDCNRCRSCFAGSASLSQMGSCGGGGRGGGVSMNNAPTNRHSAYPYMSGGGQENSPYMMGGEPPNMKYSDSKCSSSKSMESEMAMNGMGLSSSSGGGGLDHCGPGDMGMLARLTSDQGHSTCQPLKKLKKTKNGIFFIPNKLKGNNDYNFFFFTCV